MSSTKLSSPVLVNEDENCFTSSNGKVKECLLLADLNSPEEQPIGNSPNINFGAKMSFDADSEMFEELDFEDEPKTEHESVTSTNSLSTNCDTGEEKLEQDGNVKFDLKLVNDDSKDKQYINTEEKIDPRCEGEILSDESKSDEVEEGEIVDADALDMPSNYSCRFYERGKCSWGSNCRYFHLSDKGLYTMFNSPITDKICLDNLRQNNYLKPNSSVYFSIPQQRTTLCENAWDRAISEVKERVKRAKDRKEDDDFEEKKLYLSNNEEAKNSKFMSNDTTRRPNISFRSKANSSYKLQNSGKNYSSTFRNDEHESTGKEVEAKRNQNRNFLLKENYHSDWQDPWRRSKSPKGKEKPKSKSRSPSSSLVSCTSRCCSSGSVLSDISSSSLRCRRCSSGSPIPKRRKVIKRTQEHDKGHVQSPSRSLSSSSSRSTAWSRSSSRSSSRSRKRYRKTRRKDHTSRCRSPSLKRNGRDNITYKSQRNKYRSPSVIRIVTRRKTPDRKKSISPLSDSSSWSCSSENSKNVSMKGSTVLKSRTTPQPRSEFSSIFDVKPETKSKTSVSHELKKSTSAEKSQRNKFGGQAPSTSKKPSEFQKSSRSKETSSTLEAASIKRSPVNIFSTTKKPNAVKKKIQTRTINAEELLRYQSKKNIQAPTKQLPSPGISKQLDCDNVQSFRQQTVKSKNEQVTVSEQNTISTKPKISINILPKNNKAKSIKDCDKNYEDEKPQKVTHEIPSRRDYLLQQLRAVEEAIARKKESSMI